MVVLPELQNTGTCEDLFWQDAPLDAAERGLVSIAARTADVDALLLLDCLFAWPRSTTAPRSLLGRAFGPGAPSATCPCTTSSLVSDLKIVAKIFGAIWYQLLLACDTIPERRGCGDLRGPWPMPSNAYAVAITLIW